jgi:hypothetical protein
LPQLGDRSPGVEARAQDRTVIAPQLDPHVDARPDCLLGRQVCTGEPVRVAECLLGELFDQDPQHRLLRLEIEVEGGPGDPGSARKFVHADLLERALGE